jgi:NIPSNAP
MQQRIGRVILGLVVLGFAGHAASGADGTKKEEKKVDTRVFELRTYYVKPGKIKALQARFREHTNKLFEKHGMTVIGFWTPADPPKDKEMDKLIYILAFPSREAAEKSWKAFRDDPDWKKVREESEKDGALVDHVDSVFMNPTDYSPIK